MGQSREAIVRTKRTNKQKTVFQASSGMITREEAFSKLTAYILFLKL